MQQTGSRKRSQILPFCRWISHFCCSLLLFGATVLASEASERESNPGTASWLLGSLASSPSEYNRETRHPIFTTQDAASVSMYSHSRVLSQQREFETEEGFQCGLSSDVIERFYDESSQIWTVTNALLNEVNNDLQRIVDCAVQDDVLLFRTRDTIQPTSTMTIRLPLIVRGESGVTFACPQQGALIVSRSASFTMENIMISGCNGTSNIVILNPSCNGGRLRSINRLTSVSFEDNGVFDQGHLIEANSSCLQLRMTSVTFLRNLCIGTHCILLGSRTTLRDVVLESNQGSTETSLDSSIFAASRDSQTIATNVTSLRNEIRSFYISNGILNVRDSRFIGNRRNQSYVTRDNSTGGGALYSNYSSVSIVSTSFESNHALNGGAIYALSSNISTQDCLFRENDAGEGDGGAIYANYNSSLSISSSEFSMNRGSDGAAIFSFRTTVANISNSRFVENNSNSRGGILIGNGYASVRSCGFFQNTASQTGSAIFATSITLVLRNLTFDGNNGSFGGACFFQESSEVQAKNLFFNGNIALARDGGCILLARRSTMRLEDSLFQSNSARFSGGALYSTVGSFIFLERVEFLNNTSGLNGAGISVSERHFEGVALRFINNRAENYGGAISAGNNSTMSIESSEFTNNEAAAGGAIMLIGVGVSSINNCSLTGNSASSSSGAIHVTASNVALDSVKFNNNRAQVGGSMRVEGESSVTISNSLFANNTVRSTGGAIDVAVGSTLVLDQSTLSGNAAESGGGLHLSGHSTAWASDCEFVNNTAFSDGGAIRLDSSTGNLANLLFRSNSAAIGGVLYGINSSMEAVNSTFEKSNAIRSGGAICMQQSNATLENITIESNEAGGNCGGFCALDASHIQANVLLVKHNRAINAGGGIVVANASSLLCYSCMILDNRAFSGAGLYAYSNNSILMVAQLQNSRFENNSAKSYGGGIEFGAPQNRSINCSSPALTCGHVILFNTNFSSNFANRSGAAILTTDARRVLVACGYKGTRNQQFITERQFNSLEMIDPRRLCAGWRGNMLATNDFGDIVGTYGQDIVLNMSTNHEVRLLRITRNRYVLENVSSGWQLPTIDVTILDGYGRGPAPTSPYSFEARLSSPNGFFSGLYPANIFEGSGKFVNVAGFARHGNYTLEMRSDNPAIATLSIVVMVRECRVGEEPTHNRLTCQECDAFSYNFNANETGGCKECPNDAKCDGRYIVPNKGYWHNGPCHNEVQECLVEEACKYENREKALTNLTQNFTDCNLNETSLEAYQDDLCNEGYEGPLCGSCKTSYGLSFLFECLKCPRKIFSFLIIAGVTVYLFAASSLTIRGCLPFDVKRAQSRSLRLPSNESHGTETRDPEVNVEMVRMMIEGRVPPEYFQKNQGANTSRTPKESAQEETEYDLTKWKVTELFKIMINFLQTTAVAASVDVDWTDGVLGVFQTSEYVGAVATSAISRPVVCITSSSSKIMRSIWRMLFGLFVPGFVMLMFAAFWAFITLRDGESISYFTKRTVLSVIAVTYISYLGLTRTAVRAFYCVNVYDSVSPFADSRTSFWAMDTSVKCYEGDHLKLIAIGVVILAVVTVAFPLITAFVLSKKRQANRNKDSWVFETAGFLFRAFKETCLFWESLIMLRKACLSVVVVFSYPLGGLSQGILALVVLLASLYAHVTMRPYRKEFKILNHFETASLLVSCLTFTLGLFFGFDKCSKAVRFFLAFIIIMANTLFFLFLLCAFCRNVMVHVRVVLQYENIAVSDATPWWRVLKIYITSRSYRCGQLKDNI